MQQEKVKDIFWVKLVRLVLMLICYQLTLVTQGLRPRESTAPAESSTRT